MSPCPSCIHELTQFRLTGGPSRAPAEGHQEHLPYLLRPLQLGWLSAAQDEHGLFPLRVLAATQPSVDLEGNAGQGSMSKLEEWGCSQSPARRAAAHLMCACHHPGLPVG